MAFENMTLSRALSLVRQNLAPDASTLGRGTVRAYNLYLPTAYVSGPGVSTASTVTKTINTFTLLRENKYDNGSSMFDPAAPDRLTIRQPGWYVFGLTWSWAANINGARNVWTTINGAQWDTDARWPDNNGISGGTIHGFWYFNAGEYIGAQARQDTVGALVIGVDLHARFHSN